MIRCSTTLSPDTGVREQAKVNRGYIYMKKDNDTFEIGTYDDVGTKIKSKKGVTLSAPITEDDHIVTKKYVDAKTKAPTEKYDGEFTFVTELPTAKLEAGQVIFTTEDDVPIENPQKTANIHLSLDGFDWDECNTADYGYAAAPERHS